MFFSLFTFLKDTWNLLLQRTAFPRSNKMSAQPIINSLFQTNYYTGVTTSGICLKCDGTTAESGTTAGQGIMDANLSVTQLLKSPKKSPKSNSQKTINWEMLFFWMRGCWWTGTALLYTSKTWSTNHSTNMVFIVKWVGQITYWWLS